MRALRGAILRLMSPERAAAAKAEMRTRKIICTTCGWHSSA